MAARIHTSNHMKTIEDYLSRANFTVRCEDGSVVNITELSINVEPGTDEIVFHIMGNQTLDLGFARYVYGEQPYFSINDPTNEDPDNEPYYNLNFIEINKCYNGKGLAAILLYYSMDYIFQNYKNILQIQLDDDSDFGTSNDPDLRVKAIYQQMGFYRKDSVKKFINTGSPIPNPNITVGQEHFIPAKNVHGLVGWETKKNTLFSKIETKLRAISSEGRKRKPSPEAAAKPPSPKSRRATPSRKGSPKSRRASPSQAAAEPKKVSAQHKKAVGKKSANKKETKSRGKRK